MRGEAKGYVLDFSNRTFADFFVRQLDIDIDAPIYATNGTSKGKRLECFLGKVDDQTAAGTLRVLWDHREAIRKPGVPDPFTRASGQFSALITKLEGGTVTTPVNVVEAPKVEEIEFDRFRNRLISIRNLEPHSRGYEFEKFLKDLFNVFRLSARDPFKIVGEQIDGSFELEGETYLLEAKWLNKKVGVGEFGAFHSKLDQKASWARGLFVSFGGFTDVGLQGFGRGRRLVCMDGRDIDETLQRGIAIDRAISLKVRHAAETGDVFVPIDNLMP
ncbi:MAG: restriction endonuclease [Paracoccaceae bacterium]